VIEKNINLQIHESAATPVRALDSRLLSACLALPQFHNVLLFCSVLSCLCMTVLSCFIHFPGYTASSDSCLVVVMCVMYPLPPSVDLSGGPARRAASPHDSSRQGGGAPRQHPLPQIESQLLCCAVLCYVMCCVVLCYSVLFEAALGYIDRIECVCYFCGSHVVIILPVYIYIYHTISCCPLLLVKLTNASYFLTIISIVYYIIYYSSLYILYNILLSQANDSMGLLACASKFLT
jgi:hypothetical protein